MKLTGLREPLVTLEGKPVEEVYAFADDQTPLTREVTFVSLMANRIYTSQQKTDAMLLRSIAQRLFEGGDEQEFSDAEVAIMSAVLEADDTFYAFARAHCEAILTGANKVRPLPPGKRDDDDLMDDGPF